MDEKLRQDLREIPRLSQQVLLKLQATMKALARVSLASPDFQAALENSRRANREAGELLERQRSVIRAIQRSS